MIQSHYSGSGQKAMGTLSPIRMARSPQGQDNASRQGTFDFEQMRRLNVSGLLAGPTIRQEIDRVHRQQSRIQDMGELVNHQFNSAKSNSHSRGAGGNSNDSQ